MTKGKILAAIVYVIVLIYVIITWDKSMITDDGTILMELFLPRFAISMAAVIFGVKYIIEEWNSPLFK